MKSIAPTFMKGIKMSKLSLGILSLVLLHIFSTASSAGCRPMNDDELILFDNCSGYGYPERGGLLICDPFGAGPGTGHPCSSAADCANPKHCEGRYDIVTTGGACDNGGNGGGNSGPGGGGSLARPPSGGTPPPSLPPHL